MMKTTYWKCSPSVSAEIESAWKAWRALVAKANNLAKSHGATGVYTTRGIFGDPHVSGFVFPQSPDKKLFAKLKNTDDGYRPRSGTELQKQFDEFKCDCVRLAMKLTGIKASMSADADGGFYICSAGITFAGKAVYLSTNGKPTKGGKRVSDIEYEQAGKDKRRQKESP